MNAPSDDIKDILEGLSSLALTFATDLFVAKRPPLPDQCVTVYDSGGYDPQANDYERPTVQVIVRGLKGGYRTAYALAKSIKDELHEYANQTVNSTRYIAIYTQGDILSLGEDENGRPLLSVNFRIHRTG